MMRCRNERESSRCTFLRNLASHSEMLSLAIFNIILVQWAFGILWQKARIRGVQMFLWQFDIREIEFAGLVSVDRKNINNFLNLIYYLLLLLLSHFSRVQPLATPWIAAYQAPLSMGVSRQEYWSGVPLPSLLLLLDCLIQQTLRIYFVPGIALGVEDMAVCNNNNNNNKILAHLLFLSLLSFYLHHGVHSLDLG